MEYGKRPLKVKSEMEKPSLKRPASGQRSPEMKKVDSMTADLIQELMNASTSFHKLHLQLTGPGSYAAHKALNDIYDALPGLADSIAEGYQGACEVILTYKNQGPVALSTVEDAIDYMRQINGQIHELQEVMPHSEIVNDLDAVKSAIDSAKYKLLFLA